MQWSKLLSKKRLFKDTEPQSGTNARSEYHKDYDKIVFSSAFRRLGKKTQVHPLPNNDHVHTRLTHSIEAGSVGRSLGLIVGGYLCDKGYLPDNTTAQDIGDIVQAACLAHDIGNPPFGHAGEYAMRHWFKANSGKLQLSSKRQRNDLQMFEGNAQGFRIVSNIDNDCYQGGLRLSYATLGTLIKYPWFSDHPLAQAKGKFHFFQSEKNIVELITQALGLKQADDASYLRHPLSYLMEAADDICYKILDIEDALALGMLRFDDVCDIFSRLGGHSMGHRADTIQRSTVQASIIPLRSQAIENLINRCAEVFINHYETIMAGQYSSDLMTAVKGVEEQGIAEASAITRQNIFLHKRKIELEIGAYTTIETLLDAFITAINELKRGEVSFKSQRILDLMGGNSIEPQQSYYECYLQVTDLVSSMSDHQATFVANQLSGRAL